MDNILKMRRREPRSLRFFISWIPPGNGVPQQGRSIERPYVTDPFITCSPPQEVVGGVKGRGYRQGNIYGPLTLALSRGYRQGEGMMIYEVNPAFLTLDIHVCPEYVLIRPQSFKLVRETGKGSNMPILLFAPSSLPTPQPGGFFFFLQRPMPGFSQGSRRLEAFPVKGNGTKTGQDVALQLTRRRKLTKWDPGLSPGGSTSPKGIPQ